MAGWLRALRQILEIPVDEFAQRLGVSRREIFRLEKSEEERAFNWNAAAGGRGAGLRVDLRSDTTEGNAG